MWPTIYHEKLFTQNVTNITFIFETPPNTKPEDKKWGDMAYYVPPSEKVEGTSPPTNCAHDCIEYTFYIQDFWATCACLEVFHCIEYTVYIQDFWATCACPENRVCLTIFQAGKRQPLTPASYAYDCQVISNCIVFEAAFFWKLEVSWLAAAFDVFLFKSGWYTLNFMNRLWGKSELSWFFRTGNMVQRNTSDCKLDNPESQYVVETPYKKQSLF